MKRLTSPPEINPVAKELLKRGPDVFLTAIQIGLNQPKGQYLHWDKARRYKPLPDGLTAEEFWFGIKSARHQASKSIELYQKLGKRFWFTTPDQAHSLLHIIDKQAAGGVSSGNRVFGQVDKERYLTRSLVEEPFSSSVLEGAATTREVARKLIDEGRQPRTRDERMVLNNYRAMRFVKEHVDDALSIDLILEVHKIVSEGTLDDPAMEGVLRTPDRDINVVDDSSGEILHTPPQADQLEGRLQQLCDFANEPENDGQFLHPIVRAIILHFMIGYDHPFVDGNGRTARTLFYWYAIKSGYWLLEYVSISKTIMHAPAQYGLAYLQTESDDGDLTYFILHQLSVLKKALDDLYEYAERRSSQLAVFEAAIQNSQFNSRQAFLLNDAARGRPAVTDIERYRKIHKVSKLTARNDLEGLVEAGLYSKRRTGRRNVYIPIRKIVEKLTNNPNIKP